MFAKGYANVKMFSISMMSEFDLRRGVRNFVKIFENVFDIHVEIRGGVGQAFFGFFLNIFDDTSP